MNLLLHQPQLPQLEVCLEEHVPLIVTFWSDPAPYVERARGTATKVFHQAGSVAEAREAAAAGVDAVIAQGGEAGGHVKGTISLPALLPAVVDAVRPLPVLASGGIGDGRGIAAAILLGAVGVSLGTRFVTSEEAFTGRKYKERIARAGAEDTVYSAFLFDGFWPNAPHRALRNGVVREWEAAGSPSSGGRPEEGRTIARYKRPDGTELQVQRHSSFMPAAQIVRDLARETDAALA